MPPPLLFPASVPCPLQGKLRLDAFLAAGTPHLSRARVQDSIRNGHVTVNGAVQTKSAAGVLAGDNVDLLVFEPAPVAALPEVRRSFCVSHHGVFILHLHVADQRIGRRRWIATNDVAETSECRTE